jgi:hypothetical protein
MTSFDERVRAFGDLLEHDIPVQAFDCSTGRKPSTDVTE